MNTFAVFRATAKDLKDTALYVAASSFYQLWVNGRFVSFGPARTAGGYARVDEIPLGVYAKDAENEILILVAGYMCASLSTVHQPSFLQAELRKGEEVLLYTGRDFAAFLPPHRVQKVKRYSMQRHFSEAWDYTGGKAMWDEAYRTETEELQNLPRLLPRRAPYASVRDIFADKICSRGSFVYDESLPFRAAPYSEEIDPAKGCFEDQDIGCKPFEWVQRHRQEKKGGEARLPIALDEMEYAIVDFGRVETGFWQLALTAREETELVVGFSEIAARDHFTYTGMNAYNAMELHMGKGQAVDFMSFEPYTGRFVIVGVKKGAVNLQRFGVKTFEHSQEGLQAEMPRDPMLRAICRGAVRTFNHNAVDIYMDCPSRERAGWLCDSYFTGKAEYALYGNTRVEDAFLENFRLYEGNGELPEGALPMCYPADTVSRRFIPQWTMWYILEVEEYIFLRGHEGERELFRPSVEKLLKFYRAYENEDGLLEKLPSWNFVEWSRANQWTWDVNYPTNFLYAQALTAAGHLLEDDSLTKKALAVREESIRQSFDGVRFYDHAVRNEEGKLELQKDCSEIAQYYAILFGGLDMDAQEYAPLKDLVLNRCIPDSPAYPADLEPINAFIGIYLRLEALLKMKEYDLVLSDAKAFFGEMEAITGTLWEDRQIEKGSKDHGFASYAYVAIVQALKGKEN